MARIIFHIDMNSFFVACEIAQQPALRGLPVVVSGLKRRGVITTASYEARALGIKAAMPLHEAQRLCPTLIVLPVNHELYRAYSREMMAIFQRFTPLVEQASIDEAYLDMSHLIAEQTDYVAIAQAIQAALQNELGLGSSVGISYNRFLAKTASDMQKPNGLTIFKRQDIPLHLWPQAIEQMYGVGPKTAEKLRALGIETIGELAHYEDLLAIKALLGDKQATFLAERAKGNDHSLVQAHDKEHLDSIGHSRTLPNNTSEERELETLLTYLASLVAQRMHKQNVMAKTIQITIRNADFQTTTRASSQPLPLKTEAEILVAARNLFWEHWDGAPVRLLGIAVLNLQAPTLVYEQLRLF